MVNEKTIMSKKELKDEILGRMRGGLDSSGEEYSNEDLLSDYNIKCKKAGVIKNRTKVKNFFK